MSDILNKLRNVLFEANSLKQQNNALKEDVQKFELQLAENEHLLKQEMEAREYYKRAVDLIYEKSVKELTTTLNAALSYVFEDRNFRIDVELSDKRGKSLSLNMYDNGELVSLKDGMGMGVNCVISAILHLYYLNCKDKKVLLLDEAYSNIDIEHLVPFFEFFHKLVKQLGFKVIMITHDPRFMQYADKVYTVDMGNVECPVSV